jgi:integrase
MRTIVSLLFSLRKPKNYKAGDMPIYLRIPVDGQRAELAVSRKCDPARWDTASGKATGSKANSRTLNAYLDDIQFKIFEVHRKMSEADEIFTVETLKNRFVGKEEKARTLLTVFTDHNQKMKSLVGEEFEKSTLQRYETCLMHTKDFIQLQYNISDVPVTKINCAFLNDFEYYLRSVRKCGNNSAIKYIKNLGKIVRICLGNGWLAVDPYVNYKPKQKAGHREVLPKEELDQLRKKKLSVERLNAVRDMFVFCCYTGLAYVHKLKRSELVNGNLWIYTNRQKTDTLSRIPVLPVALSIIQAYKDHPQCIVKDALLPIMSNQKMNAYLKEIADLCKIKKPLTFHIARHTFATP